MDKGIRPFALAKFAELNPSRIAGELTNTQFRAHVNAAIMDAYKVSLASAATHYNHAFKAFKAAHPDLVVGLGRPPEKNNGGPKPKAVAAPAAVPDMEAAMRASCAELQPTVLQRLLAASIISGLAVHQPPASAKHSWEQEPAAEQPAADAPAARSKGSKKKKQEAEATA